jgi:hypothetical protein
MINDQTSISAPQIKQPVSPASSDSNPIAIATEKITDTQRNGSITGIGIVLGFSLTFAGQWSLGSEPWHYFSIIAIIIALPGIIAQLIALLKILSLPMVTVDDHKSLTKLFFRGMALVLSGYIIGVLVDLGMDKGWLPYW